MARIRLGDLLMKEGILDQDAMDKLLLLQKKTGQKLGRIVIDKGLVTEETLLKLLAKQLQIPYIDLNQYDINLTTAHLLPEIYARRYRALVLDREDGALLVGMADPLDINAFDAISKLLKSPIKMAVLSETLLLGAFDRIYRRTQEISEFAQKLSGEMLEDVGTVEDELFSETDRDDEEQAPVVKLLNSIFKDALQARASDIHIEPGESSLRIRFRIDGLLTENVLDDKRIAKALVQRLKLKAHLDISEKRLPQDGRFNFKIQGKAYDVRVSTLPTANGEAIVMRLLSQSSPVVDLSELGIPELLQKRLEAIYTKPHGMLLVTGPTGSGKTTTLYSILSRLNSPERKIITVEDPVEYRIERINQVQVNTKIELSFGRVLRAMLRQDPDVILIGEIRDKETAQIGMRAAVTGHLVLATLHTNDALTSAMRLIDMGAEGYMVASAVKGIIGQRLVRTLCVRCAKDDPPDLNEKEWLQAVGLDHTIAFKRAFGCSYCGHRGYVGRKGVYELLVMNLDMLNALRQNDPRAFAEAVYKDETYTPLSRGVFEMLKRGETSIAEAIRVMGQLEDEWV